MKVTHIVLFFLLLSMGCKPTGPVTTNNSTSNVAKPKKVVRLNHMNFEFNDVASLTQVVDKAISADKLVFIDVYAGWCTPCKLMDKDVFADREMAKFMKANFINYKVDGEKDNGPNLGVLFGVSGFPTLLILDQKGRVLERHDGALYQTGLRAMADRALAKSKI